MVRRKIYIFITLMIFLVIRTNIAYAVKSKNSIDVTAIKIDNLSNKRVASIIINGHIKIAEILVIEKDDKKSIRLPEYINKYGKIYPQIVILSDEAKENIKRAIISELPTTQEGKELNYKINRLFLLRSKIRRANVEVTFNGKLRIICGVMETKTGDLWIAWPSRKDSKLGWIKQVTFLKPKFQKILEREILAKYTAAKSEEL